MQGSFIVTNSDSVSQRVSGDLAIQQISNVAELNALEAEWRNLESRCDTARIFATFDYISLAWKHFHGPSDRLLVLAIRERGVLVAVAPFRMSTRSFRGIPARVVEWLATWEGDRPGLLCSVDPTACWTLLEHYFGFTFRNWDLLQLCEQGTSPTQGGPLSRSSWIETTVDSVGFYISLHDSFDDFLANIDAKVKSNWRNRSRKIDALTPTPVLGRIDDPELMEQAVDRFISIERKTWKADAGLGMGKDERHRRFYAELTTVLARRGQAAFYFLCRGDHDMAGSLVFMLGNIVYERHISHDPEFSSLSPGIVLRTDILKSLFGTTWKEFDLMGMHPSVGRQRHKADWASGQREGTSYEYYRRYGRLTPIILARRIRRWLRSKMLVDQSIVNDAGI